MSRKNKVRRRKKSTLQVDKTTSNTTKTFRYRRYIVMMSILVVLCCFCAVPRVLTLGSECYTISGEDYRGNQDRLELPGAIGSTKLLTTTECLPWNNSREFEKPRAKERGIGSHNYCRNPDGDVMPWCKVKTDGTWGYCHLPTCQAPGYLGCFVDKGHPPALDEIFVKHDGKDFTVASCLEFCRGQGYKYTGVESGMACYCGNGGYQRYGKSTQQDCATKCFGDNSQACGGDGFMDVYKSHLGQCRGEVMTSVSDVIYNYGYPYKPASADMVSSIKAANRMVVKLQNKGNVNVRMTDHLLNSAAEEPCEWIVDVADARDIRLLLRKIDKNLDLGGTLYLKGLGESSITLSLSSLQVATNNGRRSSNASVSNQVSASSKEIIIKDSIKSFGAFDIKVSKESDDLGSSKQKDASHGVVDSRENFWTLPSSSQQPLVTISGGRFSVKFIPDYEMSNYLKDTSDHNRRQKWRKRQPENKKEWARFAIEYEATFPQGQEPIELNDAMVVSDHPTTRNNVVTQKNQSRKREKKERRDRKLKPQTDDDESSKFILKLNRQDTRSILNKILPEHIFPSNEQQQDGEESKKNVSTSIQIDVTVDVGQTGEKKKKSATSISELTMPLLLAILFVTTAVLIFAAVFLIFRKGGSSFFKKKSKEPMVVNLDDNLDDGYAEKIDGSDFYLNPDGSESLSSSKRNSASIKTLIDLLKHHPGMFPRSRNEAEYKQVSQRPPNDSFVPEGSIPSLMPCPHCCNCQKNAEANDGSHNHKISPKHSPSTRAGKNAKGLTINTAKSKTLSMAPAPPLSPITEVSSVASSTLSLAPITSPNSMTSLLPKSQVLQKMNSKAVNWKHCSSAQSLENVSAEETDVFLPRVQTCNEAKFGDSELKKGKNVKISKMKPSSKRYLGGGGSSYDSGYATSNYEEEDEKNTNNKIEYRDRNVKHKLIS